MFLGSLYPEAGSIRYFISVNIWEIGMQPAYF